MDFYHGFIILTFVHLLAAASPGPDFVMVTRQTIVNGRKAGLLCSIGIAAGLSVHITYSALGMAAIVAGSATLLTIIKFLGGSYLIYLGCKGLRAKPQKASSELPSQVSRQQTPLKMVGIGFLCNALNPKAPIYFVSLFTIVLSPNLPLYQLVIYGVWLMILQFGWFALVATLLSTNTISRYFRRWAHYIDRVLGGAMLLLGLKVLTSKAS